MWGHPKPRGGAQGGSGCPSWVLGAPPRPPKPGVCVGGGHFLRLPAAAEPARGFSMRSLWGLALTRGVSNPILGLARNLALRCGHLCPVRGPPAAGWGPPAAGWGPLLHPGPCWVSGVRTWHGHRAPHLPARPRRGQEDGEQGHVPAHLRREGERLRLRGALRGKEPLQTEPLRGR